MNGLFPLVLDLMRQTLSHPRAAARRVIAMGEAVEGGVLWLALLVLAILAALLSHAMLLVLAGVEANGLMGGPLVTALVQFVVTACIVWAVVAIGRRFGGHGGRHGALAVIIWLEIVALAFQLLQVVALLFVPVIAEVISIVGVGLFFVLLSIFVAELHGFRSAPLVSLGIIGTIFAAALILSILFAIFGVSVRV